VPYLLKLRAQSVAARLGTINDVIFCCNIYANFANERKKENACGGGGGGQW
jgi:hypothetical protein